MGDDVTLDAILAGKYDILRETIQKLGRIAVAFSGGVDSTLLLKVAHDVLGDDVVAITGKSASMPAREIEACRAFCEREGIVHVIVETREFDIEGFDRNPPDRCYHCKREIMTRIREAAAGRGIRVIAEGSNLDDESDYRPGARAVAELGVASPLCTAAFTKADVRALARYLGLEVWNKPAFACLNTRFAYGDLITPELLAMVDQAEDAVRNEGVDQVRVRMQGASARIEVPEEDMGTFFDPATRARIVERFESIGFDFVSLDLNGYQRGSMNKTIEASS